eukprot:3771696-Rhodomonas_salina.2
MIVSPESECLAMEIEIGVGRGWEGGLVMGGFVGGCRGIEWTRGAQREPRWYDSILKFFNFRLGGSYLPSRVVRLTLLMGSVANQH